MVRVAKGLNGDYSAFIQGPIYEAPWDLVSALAQALKVLSWFENLPRDEQPPRHIWWSDELLEDWFEDVKRNRDKPRKRKSPYEEADDAPMSKNELVDKAKMIYG